MQPEYQDPTAQETLAGTESTSITTPNNPKQPDEQWQQVGSQVAAALAQLPNYIGNFFNEYKNLLTSLGLILGAIIAVKVSFAVLGALNSIPLVAPTFQLVGIGYSVWFVYRYLLKESNRQELYTEVQKILDKKD